MDCGDVINARGNLAPLECRELIGQLQADFLLTDVVFELYDHPNGNLSKACGFVWNALAGQWSRLLLGGNVDDNGRQYHFETGILCPRGSSLSVCTCFFVSQPTSRLWAVLSGYSCDESREMADLTTQTFQTIDWTDAQPSAVIDPIDPTRGGEQRQDMPTSLAVRVLLGTVRDSADRGDMWVDGAEGRYQVALGQTVAVRVHRPEVLRSYGDRVGTTRCPEGTNLVVVRRSVDGRSSHWICYQERRSGAVGA
jgi:hypothetical protein